VRGVRKVIAERMLASLHTTAQLTMHSSADARTLQQLRKRLKASDPALGLQGVTINDLILFAVTRVLLQHPILNATFGDNLIRQYGTVHLGFAVDTPRGLLVPVIRHAEQMSLRGLAQATKSLAAGAQDGSLAPDDLTGGTFTVTNLGSLGVDSFTPILNPPQVAILGVSSIQIKPVEVDEQLEFIPHIGLSLTINHQVVDGAPGARFLQALGQGLRDLDLLLAI
jgi:pyruvate dehydrogenase E2 component (dihydrolipoamide acetyltransferase)